MTTNPALYAASTPRKPRLIDGSFLFGNLFEFGKDPLAFIRRAVSLGEPVIDFSMPVRRISLVTSADLAHQILVKHGQHFKKADEDVGVMAQVLGNGLVTNNDAESHKKHRKLAQPGFHFRRIQSYAQTMLEYTQHCSSDWGNDEIRDVNDDMFKLTLFIVSKTLFDNDMDSMHAVSSEIGQSIHELQELMNKGFQSMYVLPKWAPMPGAKTLKQAKARLHSTIDQMIQARKNTQGQFESGDDLLSMLLEAEYEDGSKLDESQLMDELVTLLSAGHETTSNTMTWILYLLAMHPEYQEQAYIQINEALQEEPLSLESLDSMPLIEQIVKESMRLFPPAWVLNTRQAITDLEIDGYYFEKGKRVFISPYANHFNENYFPNADRFEPERFSEDREAQLPRYAFMPFGGGHRVCIGNSFAMMENRIILAQLIRTFRFEPCQQTTLEPQPHVTLSNKGGMKLRVLRRN